MANKGQMLAIDANTTLAQKLLDKDQGTGRIKLDEDLQIVEETPEKTVTVEEVAKPGIYAFFTLALVTLIRSAYVTNKNSIGFAFGYQGLGIQANNPQFVMQAAFPGLAPIYGLVASLAFSAAYSTSNIVMSANSKNWMEQEKDVGWPSE